MLNCAESLKLTHVMKDWSVLFYVTSLLTMVTSSHALRIYPEHAARRREFGEDKTLQNSNYNTPSRDKIIDFTRKALLSNILKDFNTNIKSISEYSFTRADLSPSQLTDITEDSSEFNPEFHSSLNSSFLKPKHHQSTSYSVYSQQQPGKNIDSNNPAIISNNSSASKRLIVNSAEHLLSKRGSVSWLLQAAMRMCNRHRGRCLRMQYRRGGRMKG